MSQTWNEGYFTDVGYTYGYYRDINPVFQRFCLHLRGWAAPAPAPDSAHCELGYGQGVSVNVHAAATPGLYVGTDFNPAHAAHAQGLAQAAGSGARLLDDSFEQLLARADLPQFDSISVHGIWTWVSRGNQAVIAEFARRHLKPGGVFYLSYNCFPGWAPAYPLRQMFALHDRFASTASDAVARVDAALKFSEALLAAQPNYLRAMPGLPERLKAIAGQDRHYLAHEYFNREWNCMYFTDVVDALDGAKLDFACTAVPLDAVDAVNLSAQAQGFLAGIEHPLLREQARDYFVNQQFRKDLYLRGAVRLSAAEQRQRLLDTRFALLQPPGAVELKVQGAAGEATLSEAAYRPLLHALAERQYAPQTLRELAARLPQQPLAQLVQALAVLVAKSALAPCQDEAQARLVQRRCAALNQHLCARAMAGGPAVDTLASPALGGGVGVSRFHQMFLHARAQGRKTPPEWARHAWDGLSAQGQRLVREGRTLDSAEDNLARLQQLAQQFADETLPILKALQVA